MAQELRKIKVVFLDKYVDPVLFFLGDVGVVHCMNVDEKLDSFDGLLVDYVERKGVRVILRGLRAMSDFEYEFQMAMMNRTLSKKCETVFLMPAPTYSFLSSRMIKEIAMFHGDISHFVPEIVADALKNKDFS